MRRKWPILFSIGIISLLILAPYSVLAQSSSSVPWSKICEEGKKLIEKELNLTGIPHKIFFEYARNITFSPLIVPNGTREKVKAVVLLYKLLIGSGSKAMSFLAIVSFEKEKGKIIPIGVQILKGSTALFTRRMKPMIEEGNPWIGDQIPTVAPNALSLLSIDNKYSSPISPSRIPPQIMSKLAPFRNTLEIFEKMLDNYSKEWWGPPAPGAFISTNLSYFEWASTRYLSGLSANVGKTSSLLFGISSILFPERSSGAFLEGYVGKFKDSKGEGLPAGWSISSADMLIIQGKPTYIWIVFSGSGPEKGNVTLPSLNELKASAKQALFEAFYGIAKEVNSPEMLSTYESLLQKGYAVLEGKKLKIAETTEIQKGGEQVWVGFAGQQYPLEIALMVNVHYCSPSKKQLIGFGQFLFAVNDWSCFFPKKVVSYGGLSKAFQVAKESLGEKQVIGQKLLTERGLLWNGKVYKVYFIQTNVKKGLTSEEKYFSEVFLGKAVNTQLFWTSSLSSSQIVMLDWYLIFPPIIGFGCVVGGAAYWRKKRKER